MKTPAPMATVSARFGMTTVELTVSINEIEGTLVALAELNRALVPAYPELRETTDLGSVGATHAFDTTDLDEGGRRQQIGFTIPRRSHP